MLARQFHWLPTLSSITWASSELSKLNWETTNQKKPKPKPNNNNKKQKQNPHQTQKQTNKQLLKKQQKTNPKQAAFYCVKHPCSQNQACTYRSELEPVLREEFMAQAKPTWAGRDPEAAPGKGEHTPWGHSASAWQWWQSHRAGQRQQSANPLIHIHGAHIPHPALHLHCQAGKGCQAHPVQQLQQGRAGVWHSQGCTLCVRASSPGRECPAQHKGWGRKALTEQHPAHCLTLPPGQTSTSPECPCPWELLNSCSAPFNCLRKAAWNGFIVYCFIADTSSSGWWFFNSEGPAIDPSAGFVVFLLVPWQSAAVACGAFC